MVSDEQVVEEDRIAVGLRSYAQNILVVIFGLLPLLFFPALSAPSEYTKLIIVMVGVVIALILLSLSVLRSGSISVGISYPLVALWSIAGLSFISSVLSGDFRDSLIGDLFSVHSTVFVAILALIATIFVVLKASKTAIMRMYVLLATSALVLVLFHVLRLFLGTDFLSFSVFTGSVSSPVGGWNDLALFLGLTVILSLIALEQLSLTKIGKVLFGVVVLGSLFMLGIINFFMVWVVLGIMSLVMVVYSLGKDRFQGAQLPLVGLRTHNTTAFSVALIVFVASVVFIIGGASIGSAITKYTNASYVEVRPSFEATADIARNVYRENAFLGTGANTFADAWRLHRDTAINQTVFWNTDFNAGNGYVTTFFVTTGVLGGSAWLVFILVFLVTGARKLLGAINGDRIWFFISVSSFVSALYIWIMSIVYVPGVVMLTLGALCTGVALSSLDALSGTRSRTIVVGSDRRTGFALTLVVITIIICSVSALYSISRHYMSVYAFNESVAFAQEGREMGEVEGQIQKAFALSTSDIYARRMAEYQMGRMNTLMALTEPTPEEVQAFQKARELGISAAQQAITIDAEEPGNWAVLGGIYGTLASIGVEGAMDRAREALTKSRELNPKNPLPYVELAILDARGGDLAGAREHIGQAIALKPNFTEAFFLLSQLEIAAGNVEAAIKSTQAVITLEPTNPARYYQLGVLETARKNLKNAVPAFEQAISLDTNYANARYLLALAYDELGRSADAKAQLEIVRDLNPNNDDIRNLISVIESEGSLARLRAGANKTVSESTPTTDADGTVSTTGSIDSALVTPVNTSMNRSVENTTEAE